jgi:hypothetical protein
MIKTIGLFLLLISGNVFGQRLYLHDIPNGNYTSYEVGSSIVLFMLDSSTKTQGTIVKFDKNALYLKDGTYIPIERIASILPPNNTRAIKRIVSVLAGGFLVFAGTIYFIAGAATLAEDPMLGAIVMATSTGVFIGGRYILRRSKTAHQQVLQIIIDNINYRVFIE